MQNNGKPTRPRKKKYLLRLHLCTMNANEFVMCPILLPDCVPLMNYILHCKEDNVVDDRGSHTQHVGQLS